MFITFLKVYDLKIIYNSNCVIDLDLSLQLEFLIDTGSSNMAIAGLTKRLVCTCF